MRTTSAFSKLTTAWYALRQRWLSVRPWSDLALQPPWKGASLAIVGNAGYLRDRSQGTLIDGHDLVLRMNNFQTAGWENCVGTRTDVFLSTFWHDVRLENIAQRKAKWIVASVPNNFRKRPEIHVRHGERVTAGLLKLHRQEVFVPDETYFVRLCRQLGSQPTTGAMALFLALDHLLPVCSQIYVTGFSFFHGAAFLPAGCASHYYTDQQTVPTNHDLDAEIHLFRELLAPPIAAGRIKLDPVMSQILQPVRAAA